MMREYLHPSGLETDMSGADLHSARAGVPADMSAARTSGPEGVVLSAK
jgi:hypothetical protein